MEKLYWDTCIVFDRLRERDGYYEHFVKPMVDRAEAGNLLVVTSVITQVECRYCNWIDNETISFKMIDDFFRLKWVEVVSVDERISNLAQQILRENRAEISNFDAVQLASAAIYKLHMITDDGVRKGYKPLLKFDGRYGNPKIRLLTPEQYSQINGRTLPLTGLDNEEAQIDNK